jgi:hypothetical protein
MLSNPSVQPNAAMMNHWITAILLFHFVHGLSRHEPISEDKGDPKGWIDDILFLGIS